ncbi:predicted protein [Plenodomus lingam JN3]|uniref:Predicted protein n=1 Tax=Leptosphaeria maculans (strain JN3 / isolate v23.1.3 / race Av1-4-5-6-7-8) TaxID=985895 RepID=E4ZMH9_LEPMJ|nr:predicted protein [Plenodomus lingam JN3]CBX92848.1 predicted protein [Plenodomus lingam JN3]
MPQRLAPECGRRTRRGEASDGHCTHRTRTHTHTQNVMITVRRTERHIPQ